MLQLNPPFNWAALRTIDGRTAHRVKCVEKNARKISHSLSHSGRAALGDVVGRIQRENGLNIRSIPLIYADDRQCDDGITTFSTAIGAYITGIDHDIDLQNLTPHLRSSNSYASRHTEEGTEYITKYYAADQISDQIPLLVQEYRAALDNQDILLGSALAYAHLLAIHPLTDGNGRAARRTIINVLSHLYGFPKHLLPLSLMISRDKKRHNDCLKMAQGDTDMPSYLKYFTELMGASFEMMALLAYVRLKRFGDLDDRHVANLS
ncbi:Fic family protein [Nitrospirillum sp. BR 11163]|uniref:Fic family protein n=1 Tax=Nitrospirillum sp. BR 11163 TaxID=3104323 RepID=UPI002AFEDDCA|nr:Fic family protein [Nitrospirillum sp. BR 11163]MEA1675432.1 Fic family protein [Nitrospirillum sp. BR 11163]